MADKINCGRSVSNDRSSSIRDDQAIVGFLSETSAKDVADMIGMEESAVLLRAAALKNSGAWDHYVEADAAMRRTQTVSGRQSLFVSATCAENH